MIQNQDITSFSVLFVLLIFYLFQIFQRVKLVYLFRSFGYHFRNILLPYNSDDLSISGSGTSVINYFHYFYIFFFLLINAVIISYYGAWHAGGDLKTDKNSYELFLSYFNLNSLILITILIRFLLIRFVLELFIDSKLKFLFYKNFIISIIIGLLMFLNFVIFNLNPFYEISHLYNTFLVLFLLHFIFQTKNYLSYFVKLEVKEVMYFILYLCAFKLAPWIWLHSITALK
jgi:hypothetical protein